MAVSGKFVADFSSFESAVASAETKLVSFETGANKVQSSLERMENSLSGRKLIQDATLMAQAVENIGGVTNLTDSELARMGDTAEQAIEKMNRMGVEVPPGLKKIADAAAEARTGVEGMGNAAGKAEPSTGKLSGSLRGFDGALRSAGISIGPAVQGIEDIERASGKTAAGLGKLTTAGLVFSAGLAGWKVGRAISEFFDLDTKIGNAAAKLFGWGDVAGQSAAAGADVLAKASANAGRKITDMTEAIEINRLAVVKQTAALSTGAQKTTVDMVKLREELLKIEASVVIGPQAVPNVVALGKAAVETTKNLSQMESKLASLDRLNASITDRLQALQRDIDREQREREASINARNSTSIISEIIGRITPLSEKEASNTTALERMIADLTKAVAGFQLPPFQGTGTADFAEAQRIQLAAAQRNADNIRQLEYLRQLLSVAPTRSTAPLLPTTAIVPSLGAGVFGMGTQVVMEFNITASGFFDPLAKRQLAAAISDEFISTLKLGRQMGSG